MHQIKVSGLSRGKNITFVLMNGSRPKMQTPTGGEESVFTESSGGGATQEEGTVLDPTTNSRPFTTGGVIQNGAGLVMAKLHRS